MTVVERAAPTFPDLFDVIAGNISRAVQGKSESIELALICMMAEGHLLIEDVPGVGKTSLAKAIAASIDCTWRRVQCTPDLLPSDVTGVTVWHRGRDTFEFQPGPVFCNILLADEINRAAPRTQSALLEAMEERQVTADGVTHPLERPFLVIATQNPVEHEGTYGMPDSQLDRFLLRVSLGYPDRQAELQILDTHGVTPPELEPVDLPRRGSRAHPGGGGHPRRADPEGLSGGPGRRQPPPPCAGHRHVAAGHAVDPARQPGAGRGGRTELRDP